MIIEKCMDGKVRVLVYESKCKMSGAVEREMVVNV